MDWLGVYENAICFYHRKGVVVNAELKFREGSGIDKTKAISGILKSRLAYIDKLISCAVSYRLESKHGVRGIVITGVPRIRIV